jgi:hypothetical protein
MQATSKLHQGQSRILSLSDEAVGLLDLTMRIRQPPLLEYQDRDMVPSHDDFRTASYQSQSVISMPVKGDSTRREGFVNLRAPIASSAVDLTIILQVVKPSKYCERQRYKYCDQNMDRPTSESRPLY